MIGWDHADTASYYEAFCAAHPRYRAANEDLAWRAEIGAEHRVLDFGAGMGHTSEAILPWLSAAGRVVAFEPAAAMRARGEQRIRDSRVVWADTLPDERFDRIVCGAAIWQCLPLEEILRSLAKKLNADGALAFNIPSLYLGEPDEPGVDLMAAVAGWTSTAQPVDPLPSAERISSLLSECGLTSSCWRFRQPLTQGAYRDWLKIPVLSNQWFPSMPAMERAARIEAAFRGADSAAWRWEVWTGWTASRSVASPVPTMFRQPLAETPAADDGYWYYRGLLEVSTVEALRARVVELYKRRPIHGTDDPALVELQQAVAMLPEFDAIRKHPAILEMLRRLFGTNVETKRGDVLRAVAPGEPATPPHQDQFFMQDARRVCTVWIPLSECPLRLGPLAVLAGSHRDGIRSHVANQLADSDPSLWWSTASMAQGDVLAFDGCTIHRACPNLTRDRTRFSVDFRYASVTR